MFLWPFIMAGTLLLTILNPPYTVMLVLRSVPRRAHLLLSGSASLGRQVPDAHLLAQSSWISRFDQHHRRALPASQHKDLNTSMALTVSESIVGIAAGPPIFALPWSLLPNLREVVLSVLSCRLLRVLALLCLLGFILWFACCIVNTLGVPQPTSPALEFVESLNKEVRQL